MRVLIADDDHGSRATLDATMRQLGYETIVCADGDSAWAALSAPDAPPLALLDWRMPGLDGVEICRRIRGRSGTPYIYVILVTGRTAREDVIEGLGGGADDYVTKPLDLHEFRVRIRAARRILDLQAALLAAGEKLRDQADRDSLTGIWNHRAILETLDRELERSARERHGLGLIMFDIDHFKRINDTCGHLSGDAVLREAAQRLSAGLRSYDAAGRYGGEEFLVVLPGCTMATAIALAERLRQAFTETAFATPEGAIAVTISAGVTVAEVGRVVEATELVGEADQALYCAKRAGRNAVAVAPLAVPPGGYAVHRGSGA